MAMPQTAFSSYTFRSSHGIRVARVKFPANRQRKTRPAPQAVAGGARPAERPGRPRPWKSTDAAAAARDFFNRPRRAAIRKLIRELCSDVPFDHRCAAELARLVSRREPGALAGYSDLLADVAATYPMEEWQARGYVLVAAAINAMTHAPRMRLLPLVRARLAEDRLAVRAMALEAFAWLAAREAELRDEALEMLEAARHGEPAMRASAKLMLPVVMKADSVAKRTDTGSSRRESGRIKLKQPQIRYSKSMAGSARAVVRNARTAQTSRKKKPTEKLSEAERQFLDIAMSQLDRMSDDEYREAIAKIERLVKDSRASS